ncbi:hypothetical protein [Methylobacterium soli]|uniref:DUF1236 domain-containing protein n=1 Tax=Methylobacterium soli TaxID=553447 RepID=A0A6L3SX34_9HYPH|nr:hypothetical protein [Methylobacterium soli]KAB1078351.1 hypothetical protein F6X53_14760 [Methylobacterium soli]GJE45518.1 hypothetical protein AEGHOMDF_4715 [Methylobacterium soli]
MPFTVASKTDLFLGLGIVAACILTGSMALAQPLAIRVNPRLADEGILMSGNQAATIPTLFEAGPRYTEANGRGRRVGVGSSVPDWVQIGSFQNVAVPGLNPVGYYGYFISPDDKAVVLDLGSRRIVRVIRP